LAPNPVDFQLTAMLRRTQGRAKAIGRKRTMAFIALGFLVKRDDLVAPAFK
jgi:hypothetical protein